MVGNIPGSNFSWFGELRQFRGLMFSWHTYSNYFVIRIANAPINVMPHYPPPGPYRGKGVAFDLF